MPQTATIPTTTLTHVDSSDSFTIDTQYLGVVPSCSPGPNSLVFTLYIVYTILANTVGIENGIPYIEGELVFDFENYPSMVDSWINDNGELIVEGDDANSYSIDSNGDLIYNFCS